MALVALLASSHYEAIAMFQTMSPSRLEKLASPLAWASDEPPEYVEPPLKTPFFITPHKTPFALLRRLPSHYITANSLTAGSICGTDKYCRPSGNCDKDYCYPCHCDEDLRYLETGKRKYSLLDEQRKADRLLPIPGLSGRFLIAPEYIFEQRRLAAIAHVVEDMFEAYMTGLSFEP
ncbi:hypothetical protein D6C84_06720 [Aureobasidium pullulans]|uniref:Uncharacterized protein n=1 Tax=Aureobasidium pullulans TaxID=5580 RepID=A0A4S9XNB3_AURPU|nr:hypothetical protein D6C84_06720 [Aureobasidium pullulans]